MGAGELGVPPTLDSEQYELWASVPDVAQRALDAVIAELGADAPDDLYPVAVHGSMEAAASFDATRGVGYAEWAFYFAAYRVWEHLCEDHGGDKALLSGARGAMFRFMREHHRFFDAWNDAREGDRRALVEFTDGILFAAVVEMGAPFAIMRGDEDVVVAEGARRAGEAVRQVVGGLRPDQVHLLEQCAARGEPVTRVARRLEKGYRKVLDDYHELLALCGARLGSLLGSKGLPHWHPDLSGQVFEDVPEPANDGGPGAPVVDER
jgi:hypothetical protein